MLMIEMPSVCRDYFVFKSELFEYNTRYKDNINGHVNETVYGRRIRYEKLAIWNELTDHLKDACSAYTWRKKFIILWAAQIE